MFSHLLLSSVLLLSNLSAVQPAAPPLDNLCPAVDQAASLPAEDATAADLEKAVKSDLEKANQMSCSGANCGCDVEQQYCYADCPPLGQPGDLECRNACRRAYMDCARACCGW